jgi:hypothetical protein
MQKHQCRHAIITIVKRNKRAYMEIKKQGQVDQNIKDEAHDYDYYNIRRTLWCNHNIPCNPRD